MIDNLFTYLADTMNQSLYFAFIVSAIWGILSIILSPCHLSSIPLLIAYINLNNEKSIKRTFYISLTFSIGILVSITIIGLITFILGMVVGDIGAWANYLVGLIFFVFGFYLLGIIKLPDINFQYKKKASNIYLSALLIGVIFGFALGPCTFAFLAPILGLVFQMSNHTNIMTSIFLLSGFAIGHCITISLAGTFWGWVQKLLKWNENSNALLILRKVCGTLIIIAGIYMIYTVI